MNPKMGFSAGVRMSVTDYSYITFHGDYSRQGPNTEIIGGVIYSHKLDDPSDQNTFCMLVLLRWKDALVPVVKLSINHFSGGFKL